MVSQESLLRAIRLFIGQADADIFDGLAVLADGKAQDSLFPVIGLKGIFIMNLGAVFRGLVIVTIGIDDVIQRAALMDAPLALRCRRGGCQHDDFIVFDDDIHIGKLMVNGTVFTIRRAEFPSQAVFSFIPALVQVNAV